MRPMLATTSARIPVGESWIHEVKWDGMRVIAEVTDGRLRLFSRTERDVTVAFPELAGLGEQFEDMVLDGEVVCLQGGRPSFGAMAGRFHVTDAARAARLAESAPVTLMAFDVLRMLGVGLLDRPWRDRRAVLERLDLDSARWQTPPTFTDGTTLHAATLEQGLEGIVSKDVGSIYRPGVRSSAWRKFPHRQSVSVVIGGWRLETNSPEGSRLGSVLVGVPDGDELVFVGRVGSGLAGSAGAALLAQLRPLEVESSPFAEALSGDDVRGVTWVRPEVVVDVESLGLGEVGRLRQPAYKRIRPDLAPADVEPIGTGG